MTNIHSKPKSKPYSQQVKESISKKKEARKKIVERHLRKLKTVPIKERG